MILLVHKSNWLPISLRVLILPGYWVLCYQTARMVDLFGHWSCGAACYKGLYIAERELVAQGTIEPDAVGPSSRELAVTAGAWKRVAWPRGELACSFFFIFPVTSLFIRNTTLYLGRTMGWSLGNSSLRGEGSGEKDTQAEWP